MRQVKTTKAFLHAIFHSLSVACRGGVLEDVLGLEDRFWSPWPWPRGLKSSKIFWIVKILWSAGKVFRKTFFCGDRLKNFCEDFFFWEHLCLCPWPWPRAFLSLASRVSVLGKAVFGLGLGFFLCPWPWPRALCPRLHLWLLASNIDQTGKIFSYYAATYENYNGHNYLLLHYRSILPLSITCLVLFWGKKTE